ncbi:MAG: thiamine phosphate synthase, partial [Lysobacteraceae bacterium]
YAITPEQADTQRLLLQVEAVLDAGAAVLQYRAKSANAGLRLEQAIALRVLSAPYGVPLIINDDVQLAKAIAAAGVHLGADDADPQQAREILGEQAIIGASCYASMERARTMSNAGASYLAFGAFFTSPTKPEAARAPLELLQAAQSLGKPLVAIGGILPQHVAALHAAGADLFAVISGLWHGNDSVAAASAYVAQWDACEDIAATDPDSFIS